MKYFFIISYFMVFFFIEDIVIIYNCYYKHKINTYQNKIFKVYDMRYLKNLEYFFGIQITRNKFN